MSLSALRDYLKKQNLDGFIVPHADEYQNEYLPDDAERLAWLTGFTGSAGCAVVLPDKAALFADGRYTIQAKQETAAGFQICHLIEQPPATWLAANAKAGQKIGYDPWLHTPNELARYRKLAAEKNWQLIAVTQNPIDALWGGRPEAPSAPASAQSLKYAGRSGAQKRAEIASLLKGAGCDAVLLTKPDSIAWLLNLRGADVVHNPLPLAFAVLRADETADLYIDPKKISGAVRAHLGNQVAVFPKNDLLPNLKRFQGKKVWLDHASAASRLADTLQQAGAALHDAPDPCLLPKARKNPAEQSGMRAAHRRDGLAMARFLHWLAHENPAKHDEISIDHRLQQFRAMDSLYRGDSFATIAGFGPHGAIVHYRAAEKSKSKLRKGNLLLLDSGAQYQDGTTDITRTIAFGKPTAEQRDRFTRVLKGHIALATAQFPAGTAGSQLDPLARQFLWQVGLDYDHGTGHGVGCYLCVHEGPQGIGKNPNRVALEPGMVLSNEPGYYKTGAYGIRIENLIMVKKSARKGFLEFETLTLAPIDRTLIDAKLLTPQERSWLNAYHARVYKELAKKLDKKQAAWLKKQTAKI